MSDYEQKRTNWLLEKQINILESMMEQMNLELPPEPEPFYHNWGPK